MSKTSDSPPRRTPLGSLTALLSFIVTNRTALLFVAILAGFVWDGAVFLVGPLLLPLLGTIMTLSLMDVPSAILVSPRAVIRPLLATGTVSFVLAGSLYFFMGPLVVGDPEVARGFMLLAAVPPAVAVVPFAGFLGAAMVFTLAGLVTGTLLTLVLLPLLAMVAFDGASIPVFNLLAAVIGVTLVPILLSRAIRHPALNARIAPWRPLVLKWGFFLVMYTIIARNRAFMLANPGELLPALLVAVVATFGLGPVIAVVARRLGFSAGEATGLVLLGVMKNGGLAAGLAVSLLSFRAALPAAVATVVSLLYLLSLELRKGLRNRAAE